MREGGDAESEGTDRVEHKLGLELVVERLAAQQELARVRDERLADLGAVGRQMRLLRDDTDRAREALLAQRLNGVSGTGTAADDEDVGVLGRALDLDRGRLGLARVGDRLLVGVDVDEAAVRLDLERLERVEARRVLDVAVRADVCKRVKRRARKERKGEGQQ